jgi:perosamine synthetase
MVGYKYKMSNIQAAIGCAQMERIWELIDRKREIMQYYRTRLEALGNINMNPEPIGTVNGAWMPTVVFNADTGMTRENLQKCFRDKNIDARVFFYPLSALPMFENQPQNCLAWEIPERAINLPSFHDITFEQQDCVIEVAANCLKGS